ncbi:MAG: response regulator [Sphingomonadales bacterium]|nr:response regulator [Sphingomonadales bacterium]MDE2568826.1 response regulator [Sphingomonadales bacterium]
MRILVVEDEPLLAMLLEDDLAELGHEAGGSAATVEQAMGMLDASSYDAALLDYSLSENTTSAPVAERLKREGKPFCYLSGHTSIGSGDHAPEAPLLTKPVSLAALRGALDSMVSRPAD